MNSLLHDYHQALTDWRHAMSNFEEADPELVEAAVLELRAKELKLNYYRERIRGAVSG